MPIIRVILVASLLMGVARWGWAAESTYELVLAGKSCRHTKAQEIECEYTVGKDLHFWINEVGGAFVTFYVDKSSIGGDYSARLAFSHGCVVVMPHAMIKALNLDKPGQRANYAYVSPKNGKVYQTWQECETGF